MMLGHCADGASSAASFACSVPAGSQVDCFEAIGERSLRSPNTSPAWNAWRLPFSCSIVSPCWPRGITVVPAEARSDAANLRQLRAALSIIAVRRASSVLSRRTRAVIDAFLAHLASVCRIHTVGRLPDEPVGQLDRTIAFTLQESAGEARDQALIGLAGFAPGFFPESATYEPQEVEHRTMGRLLHQGRRDEVAAALFVHPQTVRVPDVAVAGAVSGSRIATPGP